MTHRSRVLLVEDDASIQRFVQLALEPWPIDLLTAASLAQARDHLAAGSFKLVLSDLMLPDGSGLDLLQHLHDNAGLRRGAELAVFSAGVSDSARTHLMRLGIHRVLSKPIALAELERNVLEAIAAADSVPAHNNANPEHPADDVATATTWQAAIDTYFGGDAPLFHAFRRSCLVQFELDVALADSAVASGDLPSLRRVAHSLKSVLLTLGHDDLSSLARQVDAEAAARSTAAVPLWVRLRAALLQLCTIRG